MTLYALATKHDETYCAIQSHDEPTDYGTWHHYDRVQRERTFRYTWFENHCMVYFVPVN